MVYFIVVLLATESWMMYYAVSLSVIGGIHNPAIQYMLSKFVPKSEYGKIFTLCHVANAVSFLWATAFVKILCKHVQDSYPGTVYVFLCCIEGIVVILMGRLFLFVISQERRHGLIGWIMTED